MADQRPEFFYKYRPITPHTLAGLAASSLHFASPLDFNDPYDSQTRDAPLSLSADQQKDMVQKYLKETFLGLLAGGIDYDEEAVSGRDPGKLADMAIRIADFYKNGILKQIGICALSAVSHDLLLWSHYGDQHRGMCLEFRADHPDFKQARGVTYSDDVPVVDHFRAYLEDDYSALAGAMYVKHTGWCYEQEWRIVNTEGVGRMSYSYDALSTVYLGSRTPEEAIVLVATILNGLSERPKLVQLRRDETEYSLREVDISREYLVDPIEAWRDATHPDT